MTVSTKHTLFAAEIFNDPQSAAVVLGGVTRMGIMLGSEVVADTTSGQVYPTHTALYSQNPRAEISTLSVASWLDQAGLTGLQIVATSDPGVYLYAHKHSEGGTRAGATSHKRYNIKEGILIPRRLVCEHQKDAQLDYELLITYDGTNNPIVIAESQTLPSGVTDAERFTIGAWTLESVAFPQIRSLEIDFGIKAVAESADSDKWPTHVSIEEITPKVTLKGIDVGWFAAAKIPLAGLAITHANTKGYLRKRSRTAASSFVADGTAEHIKFTIEGLAVVQNAFDANGQAAAEADLEITARYDGTNTPFVLDTTSAIT